MFVDASDTVSTVEFKTLVGKLGGSAKTITGAAGDTLSMPLTWTHPKDWKQIRSIEAIAFDGAKQAGTRSRAMRSSSSSRAGVSSAPMETLARWSGAGVSGGSGDACSLREVLTSGVVRWVLELSAFAVRQAESSTDPKCLRPDPGGAPSLAGGSELRPKQCGDRCRGIAPGLWLARMRRWAVAGRIGVCVGPC